MTHGLPGRAAKGGIVMFDPNKDRVSITVQEAANSTGLKPGAIYRLVRAGEIEVIRLGGRILILFEPFRKQFGL